MLSIRQNAEGLPVRIRQLRAFIRVCQLGSMARAAAELRASQPAPELQIRNLEETFGATLVVHSTRGVSPAPEGDLVLAPAHEILDRTHAVSQSIFAWTQGQFGFSQRLHCRPNLPSHRANPAASDLAPSK
jgi:DNA-binding transcriptional LysR family regulator